MTQAATESCELPKPEQDMDPVGQRPMDWIDLKQRYDTTLEALKTVRQSYDELQAQAYALVWYVPDNVTVGAIQELKKRFKETFERAHQLEAENAQLKKDAQGVVRDTADAIMTKVDPERRTVTKRGSYTGPGEVVITFANKKGERRFVVAHQIAGGEGEFYHIYSEREIKDDVVQPSDPSAQAAQG